MTICSRRGLTGTSEDLRIWARETTDMACGDKVEELQRIVAIMSERTERVLESLDELYEGQKAIARELSELRREHEKEIALLKREVEDLKQWRAEQKKERDERDRR